MGSSSDYPSMKAAIKVLKAYQVSFEAMVVSAHRTPDWMYEFAKTAKSRGVKVIIAGAGGAAHLPGMIASLTTLPVIGVPVQSKKLRGLDSLLSIIQMPAGVPVATVGIDNSENAALLAIRMLSLSNEKLSLRLAKNQSTKAKQVKRQGLNPTAGRRKLQ